MMSDTLTEIADAFARTLYAHRSRVRAESPVAARALEALPDSVIGELAGPAAKKMSLTVSDGEQHSVGIANDVVHCMISTLACELNEAALWYWRFGGNLPYITRLLNSPAVTQVQCETFCHILFGLTRRVLPWRTTNFQPR